MEAGKCRQGAEGPPNKIKLQRCVAAQDLITHKHELLTLPEERGDAFGKPHNFPPLFPTPTLQA